VLAAAALLIAALPRPAAGTGGRTTAPADPAGRTLRPKAAAGPDARQVGQGRPDDAGWWRTIGALAAVVALIFGLRWVLRRLGRSPRAGGGGLAMEVVAHAPLGARQQLALVRLGRRLVLVGTGPSGMSPLAEVTDPDEVSELLADARRGGGGLARYLKGGTAGAGPDAAGGEDGSKDE